MAFGAVWKEEPKTEVDFLNSIDDYVKEAKIGKFFSGPNQEFLQTVASNAAALLEDKDNPFTASQITKELVPLNLFHVVIYCGT